MSCERKLKICHVITRMIVGGAQENTLLTIKGHVEKGHEVVLVTGFSPGREGELLKNVELPPFGIVEIPELVLDLLQGVHVHPQSVLCFSYLQLNH